MVRNSRNYLSLTTKMEKQWFSFDKSCNWELNELIHVKTLHANCLHIISYQWICCCSLSSSSISPWFYHEIYCHSVYASIKHIDTYMYVHTHIYMCTQHTHTELWRREMAYFFLAYDFQPLPTPSVTIAMHSDTQCRNQITEHLWFSHHS